ncbi:MAG TPA: hypothetical protein DCZ72_11385 [Armatimonadetes bacterium]|nr:hypothetical protein [Armatimonadota bacterium]
MRGDESVSGGFSTLDWRVVKSALETKPGYILDFTNDSFAAFFASYGVDIDSAEYRGFGTSKAKRLHCFLTQCEPSLAARVLDELRRLKEFLGPSTLFHEDLSEYHQLVSRLGRQTKRSAAAPADASAEATFVAQAPGASILGQLPLSGELRSILLARMDEAARCIKAEAYLAAVILAGSVLEAMCHGFGQCWPNEVQRWSEATRGRRPAQLADWRLYDWFTVLSRQGILSPPVAKFSDAIRRFRNYVHPSEQLAEGFAPNRHTADICLSVVRAAAEDLRRAAEELEASR